MTKANLDKRIDDDGILLDAQLEWEHEEGKKRKFRKIKKKKKKFSSKRFLRSMYIILSCFLLYI
jgi:hypothetical protein